MVPSFLFLPPPPLILSYHNLLKYFILSNTSSLLFFIVFSYTADCSFLLPNTVWSTQYAVALVCSLNMFINFE